jgi:RNA polymerase sigma-70 factor (ECF subfamily)
MGISDRSAERLAGQFASSQSTPSRQLMRAELKQRVMNALQRLPAERREIIVMRHLEELSVKQIAVILDIPAGSVMSWHFRGMRTLRRLLDE